MVKHKKRVMHVVECFGGGVLQSVGKLCEFAKDECDLVVYALRAETPDDFAKYYPESVRFVLWEAERSINAISDLRALMRHLCWHWPMRLCFRMWRMQLCC